MKNLNPEFWQEIETLHPEAMAVFKDFIDTYKTASGWKTLFNEGAIHHGGNAVAPKFHDLPLELQFGFVCAFAQYMIDAAVILSLNDPDVLLQDGFNLAGIKKNIKTNIFGRILTHRIEECINYFPYVKSS